MVNFMKKIWIAVLMALNISRMYGMEFQKHGKSVTSIVKTIALSALGIGTILYGTWNGIMYGNQWSHPSKDDSHKATKGDVLKNVIVPIGTGVTIFLAQSRFTGKN
jgi:hypothetical protein